ncbi:DUF445 domain-containing protein [Veronia nyctiphanis]|uniref:DUF445 domain-containing protein n=2 Tax=Veronia nyctiphanis TaxID=1278244 RepID=A0A4Q0YMM8_9GAMM|nr:DUF445 domain-containing protein [Veronia nyctiphanis]
MLFEKVPGLYGSGVIQNKFVEIRQNAKTMILDEFFSSDNVVKYIEKKSHDSAGIGTYLANMVNKFDFNPLFDAFIRRVNEGPLGVLLGLSGTTPNMDAFREPVIKNIRESLEEFCYEPNFQASLIKGLTEPEVGAGIVNQIEELIDKRLSELTPEIVKDLTHSIIHEHLGWLVVWGGIFGGLVGIVSAFFL